MVCLGSNEVNFMCWMDNKVMYMLSSFIGTQVEKKRKVFVDCPVVICQYKFTAGVNIMDQKKVTYQFDHRSKYRSSLIQKTTSYKSKISKNCFYHFFVLFKLICIFCGTSS